MSSGSAYVRPPRSKKDSEEEILRMIIQNVVPYKLKVADCGFKGRWYSAVINEYLIMSFCKPYLRSKLLRQNFVGY